MAGAESKLAQLAFTYGFDADGALEWGRRDARREARARNPDVGYYRRLGFAGLPDDEAEGMAEVEWRYEHGVGPLNLIEWCVTAWIAGKREALTPTLVKLRDSKVDAYGGRREKARRWVEARASHTDSPTTSVDIEAAEHHIVLLRAAATPVEVIFHVAELAQALDDVDWDWTHSEDGNDLDLGILGEIAPPGTEDLEDWYFERVDPKYQAWKDRWLTNPAGWAKPELAKSGSIPARPKLDDLAAKVSAAHGVAPIVDKALDALGTLPRGARITYEPATAVVTFGRNSLRITTAVGKRVSIEALVGARPVGEPVKVSVSELRRGAASSLLAVLARG